MPTTQTHGFPSAIEFDHLDPELSESNLWRHHADLLEQGQAVHSDRHGGYWILSGYDDVRRALRDHETFSSASGHRIPHVDGMLTIPIDFDPPAPGHSRGGDRRTTHHSNCVTARLVDLTTRVVQTDSDQQVDFDHLVIVIGASPRRLTDVSAELDLHYLRTSPMRNGFVRPPLRDRDWSSSVEDSSAWRSQPQSVGWASRWSSSKARRHSRRTCSPLSRLTN